MLPLSPYKRDGERDLSNTRRFLSALIEVCFIDERVTRCQFDILKYLFHGRRKNMIFQIS
jgi:hypothetical protein